MWKEKNESSAKTRQYKPLQAVNVTSAALAAVTTLVSLSVTSDVTLSQCMSTQTSLLTSTFSLTSASLLTSTFSLTSASLLTSCSRDEQRLERRLDLRELCLLVRECLLRDGSGATWNRPSTSDRCGTCRSSFFCRLRCDRLSTNHNQPDTQVSANYTQVRQTVSQSEQLDASDSNCQPTTVARHTGASNCQPITADSGVTGCQPITAADTWVHQTVSQSQQT